MIRRARLKRSAVLVCTLAVVLSCRGVSALDARPNLLIIHTDELNVRMLGCYGGAQVATPHIDWLAEQGALCTRFYATTPVCSPSRAALVTGRYPQNTMFADVEVPIPATLSKTEAQTPKWSPPQPNVSARMLRRIMPPYYGMIKCIDDNVGRMLETLRSRQLLDHTVVVFTADHGDLCGEHGRLNKGVPYDGSARIPLIVYFPHKVAAGTTVPQALSCVDFAPTVFRLMGVEHQQKFEGRDAALLFGDNVPADWNDVAVLRGTQDWLCAVTGRYKLVYSREDRPWLFDLQRDPDELTNVYDQPEHRDLVRRLAEQLVEYAHKYRDPYAEDPTIKAALEAALEAAVQ